MYPHCRTLVLSIIKPGWFSGVGGVEVGILADALVYQPEASARMSDWRVAVSSEDSDASETMADRYRTGICGGFGRDSGGCPYPGRCEEGDRGPLLKRTVPFIAGNHLEEDGSRSGFSLRGRGHRRSERGREGGQ